MVSIVILARRRLICIITVIHFIAQVPISMAQSPSSQDVYGHLRRYIYNYWNLSQHSSDETFVPERITSFDQDWIDSPHWLDMQQHTWSPTSPASSEIILDLWDHSFEGIDLANKVLDDLEKSGGNETETAEMKVLRAFFYYQLMDFFGGIPILDTSPLPSPLPTQNSREEVFNFVEVELLNAIPNLAENPTGVNYGKATKWVAYSLLAKIYLNAEVYTGNPRWQDCIAACDQVINSGWYNLTANYFDNFILSNENSSENIFVIPFAITDPSGQSIQNMDFHMRTLHYNQLDANPWNGFTTLEDFYNSFDPADLRTGDIGNGMIHQGFLVGQQKDESGVDLEDRLGNPLIFTVDVPLIADESHGVRVLKYEVDKTAPPGMGDNDYAIIRYADILLMKAESLLRLEQSSDALILVNMVRERAFEPDNPLPSVSLDDILNERGYEMYWEGFRRQDLIRFDKFNDAWTNKEESPQATRLMPIPESVVRSNPALVQNAGYGKTYTVNSTDDLGDFNTGDEICEDGLGNCTLRAAIEQANAISGLDTINFNIAGSGPHTFQPTSALPTITDPVFIDGTTEPDFAGSPIIELDGTNAGTNTNGLHITAGGSTLKGLVINRFEGVGIRILSNGGNYIQRNHIGTDPIGTIDLGNGRHGISIGIFSTNASANGNYIGTNGDGINDTSEGNLISGNGGNGILIANSDDNTIAGNFIGTDATGEVAIPNDGHGINDGGNKTIVGTDGDGWSDEQEGNLISGNSGGGVLPRTNCVVAGNYIGTDATGTVAIPNGSEGVGLSHGAKFNRIGTNADGLSDDLERNIISGNTRDGIVLKLGDGFPTGTEQNVIAGNYIGTDVTGTVNLGNGLSGITITGVSFNTIGGTTVAERNIISGNGGKGIAINGDNSTDNIVQGNFIGTNAAGDNSVPNSRSGISLENLAANNTIGGENDNEGNVISGNELHGIIVQDVSDNLIIGNYIGTMPGDSGSLGNNMSGLHLTNAFTNQISRNLISYNGASAIKIENSSAGNIIGGDTEIDGNIITNNQGGIHITGANSQKNKILFNLFSGNDNLAIDLGGDEATANDPSDTDTGPNQLQNFPQLSQLDIADSEIEITYWVDSDSASSRYPLLVQFYKSDSLGNGGVFLWTDTFKIAEFNNGGKIFDFEFSANLQNGDYIVSTATDNDGNTSEFSPKILIGPEIELSSVSLEFGEVTTEDSKQESLSISNTGNGNLIISDISIDNAVFKMDKDTLFIAPGGNASLNITFTPDEVAEESGTLTFQSNLGITEISISGSGIEPVGIGDDHNQINSVKIYPNPFQHEVLIDFNVARSGHLTILVYDLQGHQVRMLLDKDHAPGSQKILWNGRDDLNHRVSDGIYMITFLMDGEPINTQRISLSK